MRRYGSVEFARAAPVEPWAVTDAPESFVHAHLMSIVEFRLPIARIDGKRKTSQGRSVEDRVGVAAGLATSDCLPDGAVGKLIRTET